MRYIVALTGASGQIYGIRLIEELRKKGEVYVIISNTAKMVLKHETGYDIEYIKSYVLAF